MGRLRKVLVGAVAALATLTAGLVSVGSANAAGPETIKLNAASGETLTPSNFKAYELMGLSPVVDSSGNLTAVTPSSLNSDVENTIAAALHAAGVKVTSNNPYVASGSNVSAESDLLHLTEAEQVAVAKVATYLANHVSSLGTAADTGSGAAASSVTLNVPAGFYLVTDSTDGAEPILVASTLHHGTKLLSKLGSSDLGVSDVKESSSSKPTKTYTNAAGVGSSSDEPHVALGDTANFTITMRIPNSKSFKQFTLSDTPDGYNIDQSSVKVYVENASGTRTDVTSSIHKYTGSSIPSDASYPNILWSAAPTGTDTGVDGASFTITDKLFSTDPTYDSDGNMTSAGTKNTSSLINNHSGEKLVVTYTATVTKATGAKNTVDEKNTDYSGKTSDNPIPPVVNAGDPANAEVKKVDAGNTALPLAGAKFTLKDVSNSGRASKPWMKLTQGATPSASSNKWTHESTAYTFTTQADGVVDLRGLGEGTYLLHETVVPAGHLSGYTQDVNVVVAKNGTVSINYDNITNQLNKGLVSLSPATRSDTVPQILQVENLSNISQLPATGGSGIIAGIILIALLLAIGGGFIAISRKMHKDRVQAEGVRA